MSKVLHGYRMVKLIHTSSMAEVWRANAGGGDQVAMKVLSGSHPTHEAVKMLEHEAEVLKELNHENIVRFRALLSDVTPLALVIEYFPGRNLDVIWRDFSDLMDRHLHKAILQCCMALEHLHSHGYVHMDVKPGNFLLSEEGRVKLIDFGITRKIRGGWLSGHQRTDKIRGTRSYVAPEILSKRNFDGRADIYSLGIMMFALFTKTLPFTGSTTRDLTMKHLNTAPPPLTLRNKRITSEANSLVLQMLSKKPGDRPASASEVCDRLQEISIYA